MDPSMFCCLVHLLDVVVFFHVITFDRRVKMNSRFISRLLSATISLERG